MGGAEHLAVGVLRVVDTTGDGLRARLAADRLLSAARPSARGLRPHEILVVRTLRDPLPGACAIAPSIAAVLRWRDAMEARLEDARALAARPAAGPVPTDAPAVLFGDLAELLCCLTIDGAAGVAAQRWWWRSWLGSTPLDVGRVWIEHAEQAPATLVRLTARRAIPALARALSPAAAGAIAAAVARSHELGSLEIAAAAEAEADGTPPPRAAAERGSTVAADPDSPDARRPAASAQARALIAIVPEIATAAELPSEHRRLLVLGLALARQRQATRHDGFPRALDEVVAQTTPSPAPEPAPGARRAPRGAGASAGDRRAAVVSHPVKASGPEDSAPAAAPRAAGGRAAPEDERPTAGAAPVPSATDAAAKPQRAWRPARTDDPVDAGTQSVHTDLGGLFMLPGVALYLGLYGDFSRPLDRALKLDPWDLVAVLGRALAPRAPRADPAWALLGELAGRAEGEPPGAGFRAPSRWRLPVAWLEPFGPGRGPWRWHACDGRLRARHPAGFLALDVALRHEDRAAQLGRELRRWRSPPARHDPSLRVPAARRAWDLGHPPTRAALRRWTGSWLAPYVAARLRLALGARRPSAAVALTLRRRALVTVSPGRVDVTYALDDLPIAVRLAGLDRTPGWIPAAGRHLELHFA